MARSPEQRAREREARHERARAEGYRNYSERQAARRAWTRKGDPSKLRGVDASQAGRRGLVQRARNLGDRVKLDKREGADRLAGGRRQAESVAGVLRRAGDETVTVRATVNSRSWQGQDFTFRLPADELRRRIDQAGGDVGAVVADLMAERYSSGAWSAGDIAGGGGTVQIARGV